MRLEIISKVRIAMEEEELPVKKDPEEIPVDDMCEIVYVCSLLRLNDYYTRI